MLNRCTHTCCRRRRRLGSSMRHDEDTQSVLGDPRLGHGKRCTGRKIEQQLRERHRGWQAKFCGRTVCCDASEEPRLEVAGRADEDLLTHTLLRSRVAKCWNAFYPQLVTPCAYLTLCRQGIRRRTRNRDHARYLDRSRRTGGAAAKICAAFGRADAGAALSHRGAAASHDRYAARRRSLRCIAALEAYA